MIRSALALLVVAALPAQVVRTIVSNGPTNNRYDVVILGDGYQASEQARFDSDCLTFATALFNKEPYKTFGRYFNVHTVYRASNESGADHPDVNPPIYRDTVYGATYNTGGTARCLYITNTSLALADAALAPANEGRVLVMVNDSRYGGCAGQFAVSYNGSSMNEVQIHEMGHSVGAGRRVLVHGSGLLRAGAGTGERHHRHRGHQVEPLARQQRDRRLPGLPLQRVRALPAAERLPDAEPRAWVVLGLLRGPGPARAWFGDGDRPAAAAGDDRDPRSERIPGVLLHEHRADHEQRPDHLEARRQPGRDGHDHPHRAGVGAEPRSARAAGRTPRSHGVRAPRSVAAVAAGTRVVGAGHGTGARPRGRCVRAVGHDHPGGHRHRPRHDRTQRRHDVGAGA
ncbi:MAG: hypothetical protein IPM13_19425 [Phycisphaerales bacterium]|nr:hypothetical protein [Phycisphaerales bacterium]